MDGYRFYIPTAVSVSFMLLVAAAGHFRDKESGDLAGVTATLSEAHIKA